MDAATLAACDAAIRRCPDDYRLYVQRAELLTRLGRPAEALADWQKATQFNALDAWLWDRLAAARYALADYAGAAADYDKAIALRPGVAEFYQHRGVVRAALQQAVEACADLDRALELEPGDPGTLYLRGSLRRQIGQLAAARADLDAALAVQPHDPDIYEERGLVWAALGAVEQAEADFRRALDLDPGAERYVRCGAWLAGHGLPEAALPYLHRAVELAPVTARVRAQALAARGSVHEALGGLAAALADYRQATAVAAGDPALWVHCARLELQQGAWQAAWLAAARALALAPDHAPAYHCRAAAHLGLHHYAEARADLRKLLSLSTDVTERAWAEETLAGLAQQEPDQAQPRGLLARLRGR